MIKTLILPAAAIALVVWTILAVNGTPDANETMGITILSLATAYLFNFIRKRLVRNGAKGPDRSILPTLVVWTMASGIYVWTGCSTRHLAERTEVRTTASEGTLIKEPAGASASDTNGYCNRITTRGYIVNGECEDEHYGLFSYVLFSAPPNDATKRRYLAILKSFLEQLPEIKGFEKENEILKRKINITYVPVTDTPPGNVNEDWLLANYDYSRSQFLLSKVPKKTKISEHLAGPYIISFETPLSRLQPENSSHFLYQNLSFAEANQVGRWIQAFRIQADQPLFWQSRTRTIWLLNFRTVLTNTGAVGPQIAGDLGKLVSWFGQPPAKSH